MSALVQLRQFFLRPFLDRPSSDGGVHPFDRLHGVDTSGLLYADALATGHAHDASSEGYYATAPSLFHGALARWQATLSGRPGQNWSLADYTFIDLGCGKGRVLLMASEHPFRKITGVELNAKLAKVARRNVARWLRTRRACSHISLMVGDVMQLRLPEGPVVLFLFNSFAAPVMTELLEGLAAAARLRSTDKSPQHPGSPRTAAVHGVEQRGAPKKPSLLHGLQEQGLVDAVAPIDLIYLHPEQNNLVRRAPGFELLADEEIPFSAEDAAADAFEVSHDRCAIYRLRPYPPSPLF